MSIQVEKTGGGLHLSEKVCLERRKDGAERRSRLEGVNIFFEIEKLKSLLPIVRQQLKEY